MVRAQLKRLLERGWSPSRIAIWISATTSTLRCPVSTTAMVSTSAICHPTGLTRRYASAHSQRLSFATAPAL